jgi:hypothetical protein
LRGVWPREARRGSARGPLLPVETLAAQNVAGQTLVKAEAAGGGGRRPAFTRVWPATRIGGRGRWAEITPVCRLIFRPSHAREDKGRRSSTSRAPSSRRTWACAPSLSGDFRLTTRLVSRVGWRLTMMSGARGTAIGSARRKSRGELCRGRPIIAPQPCIRRALRPEPMMHSCASAA